MLEHDDSLLPIPLPWYEAREQPGECEERELKSSQPNSGTIEISQVQMSEAGSTQYQPLDSSKNSIRLLYLMPGNQNCEIRCTTKHFLAGRCPHYAAVSYTWGDPSVIRRIWLNDEPFLVRQNLWDLLHQFRNDKTALILWIDAICINQDNVRERNDQVDLMSLIYKNAECVLVWLGAARDDSDLAIACLKCIQGEHVCYCNPFGDAELGSEPGPYTWNRPQRHKCDIVEEYATALNKKPPLADVYDRGKIAIVKLLEREYWQRAWIIQEILLARHIDVCCGEYVVQWDTFQSFIQNEKPQPKMSIAQYSKMDGSGGSGGSTMVTATYTTRMERKLPTNVSHLSSRIAKSPAFRLCEQRQARRKRGYYSPVFESLPSSRDQNIRQAFKLAELIQQNVHAQCTDPRDRVYAFLGLATDCADGAGIRPDYAKSPVQLYIDVVRFSEAAETGLQFMLTLRNMLRVTSIEVDHFVRNRGSPFLSRSIFQQEMVNLTAAHMGIISEVFPNWFANNRSSVSETRRFLKLTLGDLPPWTINEVFRRESLKNFLPELSNMKSVVVGSESQPVLILTGRRATFRVGFGCSGTRIGDLVCQFANSESAIIVRKVKKSYAIVGKATMMKQHLPKEIDGFMFSAISQDGLEKTTQLTWRLHPLDLVDWEVSNQQGLGLSMIRPPRLIS
jgi:hypothetical protein